MRVDALAWISVAVVLRGRLAHAWVPVGLNAQSLADFFHCFEWIDVFSHDCGDPRVLVCGPRSGGIVLSLDDGETRVLVCGPRSGGIILSPDVGKTRVVVAGRDL